MAALDFLKDFVKEKKTIAIKIKLDEDIVDAMDFIVKNSNITMDSLIEAAVEKLDYKKVATTYKKEIENKKD